MTLLNLNERAKNNSHGYQAQEQSSDRRVPFYLSCGYFSVENYCTGGSGAGKTSLLNVLCGRAHYGKVGGAIRVNGNLAKMEIARIPWALFLRTTSYMQNSR